MGTDVVEKEVRGVKVRTGGETAHATVVYFADDTTVSAEDAIALLDAGAILFMIPPPGAPTHTVYRRTEHGSEVVGHGLPFLLQHRFCDDCQREVLWA